MKTKIIGLLAFVLIFIMCTDETDFTQTLKIDGSLSVNVTDSSDNSIENTKVNLYVESITGDLLDAFYTNSNGNVDFGEVLAGTYVVTIDTPIVNGIKYHPVKLLQVTSGSDKKAIINVQEFIGKIKLTINMSSYLGGGPFSNLNVILVPDELYSASYTVADLIEVAEFSGKTDAQGVFTYSIPSDRDFRLIVYNSRKDRKNVLTSLNLLKDELQKLTFSLDTSLYMIKYYKK